MSVMIDAYKIGRLMREKGMKQNDLARTIGIDRKTLGTYLKTGEVKKPQYMQPLAEALGVEVNWLYPSPSGDMSMSNNTQTGQGNAIGSKDVSTTIGTNDEEKRQMLKTISDLQKEKERLLTIIERLSIK